ncbi:Uncharacterised protein [uncultured archaeon]|nr:Uncharacterised protein [uncultured archaeon]
MTTTYTDSVYIENLTSGTHFNTPTLVQIPENYAGTVELSTGPYAGSYFMTVVPATGLAGATSCFEITKSDQTLVGQCWRVAHTTGSRGEGIMFEWPANQRPAIKNFPQPSGATGALIDYYVRLMG